LAAVKVLLLSAGLLLGGGLVPAGAVPASPGGLDELTRDSPFLPHVGSTAEVLTMALEFRGMLTSPEGVMVGLYDRASNNSYWLPAPKPGQEGPAAAPGEIAVRGFDAQTSRLRVDVAGRVYTLMLVPSKVGLALPTADAVPAPEVVPVVAGNVSEIAGEVQRRRSLRQVEIVNQVLREAGPNELAPGSAGATE
jgi:hypothetical protein